MFKPIRFSTENMDPATVVDPATVASPAVVDPAVVVEPTPANTAPVDDPDLEKDEIIGDTSEVQDAPSAAVVEAADKLDEVVEDIENHVQTINEVEERQEIIRGALESAEYTDASVRAASDVLRVLEESEFPLDRVAVECDPADTERYQHMLAVEASESYLEYVGNSLQQLISVSWEAVLDTFIQTFTNESSMIDMYKTRIEDVRNKYNDNRKNIDDNVLRVHISATYFWAFCSRDSRLVTDYVREFIKDSQASKALLNGFVKDRRDDVKSLTRIISATKIATDSDVVKAAKNLTATIKPISQSSAAQDTGYEALLGNGRLFLRQGKPVWFSTTEVGTPAMIELSRVTRLTETRTFAQWFLDIFRRGEHNTLAKDPYIMAGRDIIELLVRRVRPIAAGDIPKLIGAAETYYEGMAGYRKNIEDFKKEIKDLKNAIKNAPKYEKAADARAYFKTISVQVTNLTTAIKHPGVDEFYRAMSGLRSSYYVAKLVVNRAEKQAGKAMAKNV